MGPRFRACLGGAALATVVLVACGGKVFEDSGSITIGGPSRKVGGSSGSSGQSGSSGSAINNGGDDGGRGYPSYPPPRADGGVRFSTGPDGGAEIFDDVIAYASPGPQGVATKDNVHAMFDTEARLYGYDHFYPFPPDPTADAQRWWAWGSPTLDGNRVYYAIGQGVLNGQLDAALASTVFKLEGGGAIADSRVSDWEISASCDATYATCKIQVNLIRGPGHAAQYVPAAKIDGVHITDDDLSTKSRLRGAFTCGQSCYGGSAGYGMVIAFAVQDPETKELLYGAAALSGTPY